MAKTSGEADNGAGRSHSGNPDRNKEKPIWVTKEKKTKAREKKRKKPNSVQRINEN